MALATRRTEQAPRRLRFTVDDYYRMAQAGIFSGGQNVELIDGEIVRMSPIGSRHAAAVDRLVDAFAHRLQGRAILRCQSPLRLDQRSEPEPDLALLRPREDFYATAHPGAADVFLVVEVADSSLGFDREVKTPLYLEAGVPEVWLVDLAGGRLTVHRVGEPTRQLQSGQSVSPRALPDLTIELASVLSGR